MKKSLLIPALFFTSFTMADNIPYKNPAIEPTALSYEYTPLKAIIADDPFINTGMLTNIAFTQVLNNVENPTQAVLTLIESELMDDSIAAIRTTYYVEKAEKGWFIANKETTYRCYRGDDTESFLAIKCP